MKTKTLYHGTTLENWLNIKENGFGGTVSTWDCSCTDYETYFYCRTKAKKENNLESKEEAEQYCIRMAFESAQIAAAVNNVLKPELVVIKMVVPANFVEHDYSCENMDDIASCVNNDDLNEFGRIEEVYICEEGYNPALQAFILLGLLNNNYLNTYIINEYALKAAELIRDAGIYLGDYLDYLEFDYNTLETVNI